MLSYITLLPLIPDQHLTFGQSSQKTYFLTNSNSYKLNHVQFNYIKSNFYPIYSYQNGNKDPLSTPHFKVSVQGVSVPKSRLYAEKDVDKKDGNINEICDQGEERKVPGILNSKNSISLPSQELCLVMFICSFIFGPFLDGYHSAFHVLSYNNPHPLYLGNMRLFLTDFWVPPLFGFAGTIMSTLYIILDQLFITDQKKRTPAWSKIFLGISFFSFQYWASGYLSYEEPLITEDMLWNILCYSGIFGYFLFDFTLAGLIVSILTAISGPLLEIILINKLNLYHYLKPNFLGIPLWIIPIYFLGGQAVGNLARGIKIKLENTDDK